MKITLIRHGESESNVGQFINDDPTKAINLTVKGQMQAETLAHQLKNEVFSAAYASQFPRAQQTARILLRQLPNTLLVDARLNERKSGLDGLPVQAFNEPLKRDPLHYKTAQGESFLEQMERMRQFLDEMSNRYPDCSILAVSHENPIIAALALTVEDASSVVFKQLDNCGRLDLNWPAKQQSS